MKGAATSGIECICTSCEKHFVLLGSDKLNETGFNPGHVGYASSDLECCGCESDPLHAAYITCPHCKHEHSVW